MTKEAQQEQSFLTREIESFNTEIQSLHVRSRMTYTEISNEANVSINSVYTCQTSKNMQLETYLKQLNCYLKERGYSLDFISLNGLVPKCVQDGKNLVILEVDDEELEKLRDKGIVILEKA